MEYWDVAELSKKHGATSYRDFEGLADPDGLEAAVDKALKANGYSKDDPELLDPEVYEFIRDVALHLMYESRDEADVDLTQQEIGMVLITAERLINTGTWIKTKQK